ncbi:MAG TPA: Hsp20/alpha crystallin family protein [Blastocatellia bacterium]|nr:Hsp20/alpha crystallin family protein [Blastocatellia bacterium]
MQTGTALAPRRSLRNLNKQTFEFLPRFNRMLEELGIQPFTEENALVAWTPACDIYETDKAIVLKVELPGIKKEEVSVSIENNLLTIHGERKFQEETKRENYYRVERNYGEFFRSFTLPNYIEPAKILAEFKEGLLILNLPKREEAKPKQVEIKVQ